MAREVALLGCPTAAAHVARPDPGALYCPPGTQIAVAEPAPMHEKPAAQSVFAAQGKAHLPTAVLHLCVPQTMSFEHGSASGPGCPVVAAGAVVPGCWYCPGC
jgi:hypothetical protein